MAIGHAMVTILPARCLRPAGTRHRSEKLVLYAPLRVASIRFSLASLMSVHRGSCKHARWHRHGDRARHGHDIARALPPPCGHPAPLRKARALRAAPRRKHSLFVSIANERASRFVQARPPRTLIAIGQYRKKKLDSVFFEIYNM